MKREKCTMCSGTGQVVVGSDYMGKQTGNRNTCPECSGRGYVYK